MSEAERLVGMLDEIIKIIENLNKSLKEILEGKNETDEERQPV